jgi:hypothetical protein
MISRRLLEPLRELGRLLAEEQRATAALREQLSPSRMNGYC